LTIILSPFYYYHGLATQQRVRRSSFQSPSRCSPSTTSAIWCVN